MGLQASLHKIEIFKNPPFANKRVFSPLGLLFENIVDFEV